MVRVAARAMSHPRRPAPPRQPSPPREPGRAPACPPRPARSAVVLAQPAPRPVADLGVRPGAAGRAPRDVRDRPAVLRRLQSPACPVNDETPGKGLLRFYLFSWPTHPAWLYRVNQGIHVTLGLALVPILLVKLWSVLPKLFEWPPLRSPAHLLERICLFLLVGGVVFEFATGILDIQNFYAFPGLLLHAALLRRLGVHRAAWSST